MRRCTISKFVPLTVTVVLLSLAVCFAKEDAKKDISGKVQGKIFTDWGVTLTKSQNGAGEDTTLVSHGFSAQRAYFGYKMTVNKKFVGRVMLDVGRVNEIVGVDIDTAGNVDFKYDTRLEAYAKYAYLQIKKIIPKHL